MESVPSMVKQEQPPEAQPAEKSDWTFPRLRKLDLGETLESDGVVEDGAAFAS